MYSIESDSSAVEKTLLEMIRLLELEGAYIDENITFRFSQGSFSVSSELYREDADDEKLLFIPNSCLIPIDLFELGLADDNIFIVKTDSKVTKIQLRLMELQLDLYNLAGKIRQVSELSHRFALGESHPISQKLESLRTIPSPYEQKALISETNLINPKAKIDQLLSQYKMSHTDASIGSILMPLILLLNHHNDGAGYNLDENGVSINCNRPMPGSNECYAFYGRGKDVLINYFLYQYYDPDKSFAYCVPQKIHLKNNLGAITINASPHTPGLTVQSQLPKYSKNGSVITCNFLMASIDPKSNILDMCIPLFIQLLDPFGMTKEIVSEIKNTILENSIKYYRELLLMIEQEPVTQENSLALPILEKISKHQINIFEESKS